jgi:hypothetical protein
MNLFEVEAGTRRKRISSQEIAKEKLKNIS